jgi:hypothetical protein
VPGSLSSDAAVTQDCAGGEERMCATSTSVSAGWRKPRSALRERRAAREEGSRDSSQRGDSRREGERSRPSSARSGVARGRRRQRSGGWPGDAKGYARREVSRMPSTHANCVTVPSVPRIEGGEISPR